MSTIIVISETNLSHKWSSSYHYDNDEDIAVLVDDYLMNDHHLLENSRARLSRAQEFLDDEDNS